MNVYIILGEVYAQKDRFYHHHSHGPWKRSAVDDGKIQQESAAKVQEIVAESLEDMVTEV
ncbi:hypothetical protein [Treponema primitia]|uniref:hypothetical protein n=1 Tax=Treponema primitia TaxID=88058 RepID=UPI0003030DBA|nr:hypothetical protein [Treponema primitia]